MSLLETLRKNLTPELFVQVTDKLGDDFDYDQVPRTRLNAVIKQRNDLRAAMAEGSHPQKPSGKASKTTDPDDPDGLLDGAPPAGGSGDVDIDELKKQWAAEHANEVNAVKIQFAALDKLRAANAVDPELIWGSSIIDKSTVTIDESGAVKGLDELIEALTKSKPALFAAPKDPVPPGTGKEGGSDDFTGVKSKDDFLKLPTDKQLAFKQANPEVFKTFLSAQ